MAANQLPLDTLSHLLNYLPSSTIIPSIHSLLLTCLDWYQVINGEGGKQFWVVVLKILLERENQINHVEDIQKIIENLNHSSDNWFIRIGSIIDHKRRFMKKVERMKQLILAERKLENSSVILYQELTRNFHKKISTFYIEKHVEQSIIEMYIISSSTEHYDALETDWNCKIMNYFQSRPFGRSIKKLLNMKLHDRPLVSYLILSFRSHKKWDFVENLMEDYQIHILPFFQKLSKQYSINKSNVEDLVSYVEREIIETRGKTIPLTIFPDLFNCNFFTTEHFNRITPLIRKFKIRDFKPKLLNNQFKPILTEISKNELNLGEKLHFFISVLEGFKLKNFHVGNVIAHVLKYGRLGRFGGLKAALDSIPLEYALQVKKIHHVSNSIFSNNTSVSLQEKTERMVFLRFLEGKFPNASFQ